MSLGFGAHVLARAATLPAVPRASAGAAHDIATLTTQFGGGFFALGLLAGYFAYTLPSRTVLKLEVLKAPGQAPGGQFSVDAVPDAKLVEGLNLRPEDARALCGHHPLDQVRITNPGILWGSRSSVYPRHRVACTSGNRIIQSFRIKAANGRVVKHQYLFPIEPHWRSEDLPYLRTLVYGEYFRPHEKPPAPDVRAIAIEGFGPYRPAQFADPHHPGFQMFAKTESRALEGTPFRIARGTVWADFQLPRVPSTSLEGRRDIERKMRIQGMAEEDAVAGHLPKPAAPATLMLDGSTYVKTQGSSGLSEPQVALPAPQGAQQGETDSAQEAKEQGKATQ